MDDRPLPPDRECYRVGDLFVDVGARRIRRQDRLISLPNLAFDLLVELVRRSPDVLSTEELLKRLWPDVVVGEENLKQRALQLRRGLEDDAREPRYVATVRGRGYQLVADVERVATRATEVSRPVRRLSSLPTWTTVAIGLTATAAVGALLAWILWLSTPATAPERGPVRAQVFVGLFENPSGDPDLEALAHMTCNQLSQGLAATNMVKVVPATAALFISDLHREPIAGEGGATHMIYGSLHRRGDELTLYAFLAEVSSGTVVASLEPVRGSVSEPSTALSELSRRTQAAVANAVDPFIASFTEGASRPGNFEAYREHVEGLALYKELDYVAAIKKFERAAKLDPTFAGPRLMLAIARQSLGEHERAEQLVLELLERHPPVPMVDRLVLRELLSLCRGENLEALRLARQLARRAPTSPYAFEAGRLALLNNRPREAIERLTALDPEGRVLEGFLPYWYFLTLALHAAGDFEGELEVAQRARGHHPDSLNALLFGVRAAAALGREGLVTSLLAQGEMLAEEAGLTRAGVAWNAAAELDAHGYSDLAHGMAQRTLRAVEATPTPNFNERFEAGRLLFFLDQFEQARVRFAELQAELPDRLEVLGYLGVSAARSGRLDEAQAMSRRLEKLSGQPYLFGEDLFWRAGVLASSDPQAAVSLLQRAVRQGFPYWHSPRNRATSPRLHANATLTPLWETQAFQDFIRIEELDRHR